MAVAVTGTPASVQATSITLPAHAVGDLLLIFCAVASTTVPTPPAAGGTVPTWTLIRSQVGTSSSGGVWYAVASATNHTSGTWSANNGLGAINLRGSAGLFGGQASDVTGTTTTITAPAVTQVDTSGAALLLEFYFNRSVTVWSAAPANYTQQTSIATTGGICINSKNSSTTDGAIAQGITSASSNNVSFQIEFIVPVVVPGRPLFNAIPFMR